jgi:predicted Zn-dependent peptidase
VPELLTLANGLRVVVVPMPHARSVALSIYVSAGSRFEAAADAGLSHFVEHLCFKGTERRPRPKDVAIEIDAMGGSINAATEREYTVYYAKVTPEHAARALDVLGDMVRHSLFAPAEVERERGVVLEELAAVEDSPDEHVGVLLDGLLWPGQAHGRDIAGTPETVAAIGRERLYAYYRAQHVANGVVVAIAGAIEAGAARELVERTFGGWAAGAPASWAPNRPTLGPRVHLLAKDTEQAHLALGLPGFGAADPDRYPLGLLSVVVGEGMSSRLFLRLREELGLCYDVRSQLTQLLDTGSFAVSAGVDTARAAEAVGEIARELARAREPVSAAELERAQGLVRSRIQLYMEDTQSVAGWYGARAVRGLPLDAPEQVIGCFERVSVDDVTRVAQAVLRDEALHLAAIGPFEDERALAERATLEC